MGVTSAQRSGKRSVRLAASWNLDPFGPKETVYGDHFALHRTESEKWYRTRLKQVEEPSAISSSASIQDPMERKRQGSFGFANQFLKRLNCDRPSRKLRSPVLEVFGDSGWASQASGEGFLYVMKGKLLFEIEGEQCEINEGAAITFDRTVRHRQRLAVDTLDLPVVILYVKTD
jgi:hypothetical protein